MTFQFNPMGPGPSYAVTTTDTSVTIPDLTAQGLALPAATGYSWSVFATPEILDMSQAVTGLGYIGAYVELAYALSLGGPAPSADGMISLSESRQFTTQ